MNPVSTRLASAVLFVVTLAALGTAADTYQAARDTQQPNAAQQPGTMQTQDARPISGTIMKEKGKYVLKDAATKMTYQLDDQDKAKTFESKQVKVTGKLDLDTNLIHVESIELLQ